MEDKTNPGTTFKNERFEVLADVRPLHKILNFIENDKNVKWLAYKAVEQLKETVKQFQEDQDGDRTICNQRG